MAHLLSFFLPFTQFPLNILPNSATNRAGPSSLTINLEGFWRLHRLLGEIPLPYSPIDYSLKVIISSLEWLDQFARVLLPILLKFGEFMVPFVVFLLLELEFVAAFLFLIRSFLQSEILSLSYFFCNLFSIALIVAGILLQLS